MNPFGSIQLVVDPLLGPYQFRFPRSKKRRIHKKYTQNRLNWRGPETDTAFKVGNTLIVSPATMHNLNKIIEEDNAYIAGFAQV